VLALTPVPLKTAGERALFGELTRWDTGGSVRAAVMASLPLADGSSQRRMSDAVLFVPEGLAVVRIAEVVRQSGVVTASPEGAWTIAPESGPSQALQLSGGGSSPLDGLMRAGMDTAMKLRRAGLEPGRIARLTVLVGDITGLLPTDGDLGEGDQVATLDPRSLLLGIARASRYAGVDNPRLWTTADVRAGLEALGLEGRGPSVEELNGEGFPYSPYVLRRAELLTPAAMAVASESAASQASAAQAAAPPAPSIPAPSSARGPVPPVREQPAPEAIAQAVAASAAAAQSASPPPPPPVGPPPVAPPPAVPLPVQRDTVAIDDPQQEDVGIGGLFSGADSAGGEPAGSDVERRAADRRQSDRAARESSAGTAMFPASEPPPRTSVFAAPWPEPAPAPAPAQQRFAYWSESEAPTARPDGSDESDEPSHHLRTALLILAGLVVVALLGVAGWSLLGGRDDAGGGTAAGPSASESAAPGPQVGTVQEVSGVGYTLGAVDVAETCVGHAYGAVADSFATTDCTALSRALYSADVGGEAVVVSVARVQMPDAPTARALRALTDQNGSGNVSDLLREGVRYTGSPAELSGAEYASALSGSTVTIVEVARAAEDGQLSDSELDRIAGEALALEVPPFPAA
jgi:hypothetical protein